MFSSHNLTILNIEKDPALRAKGTNLMNENGLNVFESDNTSEGCELFQKHEIDIVFIDLELPEKSGLDFIHFLRKKEVFTPIIITTDHTDKETLLEAINLDITRYIIKPCNKEQMVEALQLAVKKAINCHPITFTHLHNGFSYDPINKSVNRPDGVSIPLSKKEYLLLELFLKNKHQIVPYDLIEMLVWQESLMSMDALRTLIRGLRKKTYPDIISNHNGIGYKIDL